MKRKRRIAGANLAFLDVMACGLGAAVLLFLIIKHHTGAQPIVEDAVSSDREVLSMLKQSEADLVEQVKTLSERIGTLEAMNKSTEEMIETHKAKQDELSGLKVQIAIEQAKKAALEKQVVNQQPQQTADVIDDPQVGEEDYLVGLKVEGKRIAILLDRSASMTDAKLVDIITRKLGSNARKKQGPKWHRTIRVARWLLARLPDDSQVAVIVFNDKGKILNRGKWASARDKQQINDIISEIVSAVPTGATNLEAGLRELDRLKPVATDIYVVTDGLPTQSVSSLGLQLQRNCKKSASIVTGQCRELIFDTAISRSAPRGRTKVNVILLPIEGDPSAAPRFWNWTAKTGGMLLVPAAGWP